MISSFAAGVAISALLEIAWRSSAIVVGTWALLRAWQSVSAPDRRRVWIVAHLGILIVTAESLFVAGKVAINGAPTSRTVVIQDGAQSQRLEVPVQQRRASNWSLFFVAIAVAGSALSVGLQVHRARKMSRLVARAAVASEGDLRAVEQASMLAGLRSVPDVRLSSALFTAAVCGVIRPTLLLGTSSKDWSSERRDHVVAHEVQHIAGGDLLVVRLSDVVIALQWWNPVIHFASRTLAFAQEMACDARVVAGGISSASYAETLLDLTKALSHNRFATELGVGGASLAARIGALLDEGRTPLRTNGRALLTTAILLCVAVSLAPTTFSLRASRDVETVDMNSLALPKGAPRKVFIGRDAQGDVVVRPGGADGQSTH